MFQLLIVDDEQSVVDGVAATLPCKKLEIDTVHKAYSASEALMIANAHPIDLLITDIRMPGLSGLELMDKLLAMSKTTKCILLTGHAEFTYAKKALQSGVSDYLLKPVDDNDLLCAVEKTLSELRQEWESVASHEKSLQALKENLPLLRRDLLMDLLQGRFVHPSVLVTKLETLNISFYSGDAAAVIMIRLEEPFIHYAHHDQMLLEYAVGNIAEEVLRNKYRIWFCKDAHDYLIFLVTLYEDRFPRKPNPGMSEKQELERLCEQLQSHVGFYLKGSISVVITEWGAFPQSLPEAYESALSSFRKHIGSAQGFLLSLREQQNAVVIHTLKHLYEPPLLSDLLEAGRWDSFMEKLGLIFDELESCFPDSTEHAFEVYCAVTGVLAAIAHRSGRGFFDFVHAEDQKWLSFGSFRTLRQLREESFRLASSMRDALVNEAPVAHSGLIKKVRRFIDEQLASVLSLQMIAGYVYLHPVYVSQVYKTMTGESLSDYILRARMEKAAYLLKTTSYKIYEIGTRVGYQQAPYFIKVYKKYYGMTPQEYREMHSV